MKTWETFSMERYNKGREDGRAEVRKEIRERLAQREAAEMGDLDDWLDEILSDLSENGGGEKRRRPRD